MQPLVTSSLKGIAKMAKAKGLGKGLSALISEDTFVAPPQEGEDQKLVFTVKTNKIRPNADQPRKEFNREAIGELAASIKEHGVLQPLLVRAEKNGYTIIAGERRWRAATAAGLKEIPVIIKDLEDKEVLEVALIENVQREDLNPMEEARAYRMLMDNYNLNAGEVGIRIGKSRSAVANTLRLLNLPDGVAKYVLSGELSYGHARALLPVEDEEQALDIAQRIIAEGLSVRETEALIRKLNRPVEEKREPQENPYIVAVEDALNHKLATKVKIKEKSQEKGMIQLDYYSLEDLNRILGLLGLEMES